MICKMLGVVLGLTLVACVPAKSRDMQEEVFLEQRVRELMAVGNESLRAGELQEAEATYSLVLELVPGDPRALDGLGAVAQRRGDVPAAKTFFIAAARANPKYDRPIAHLAQVVAANGERVLS